MCGVPGSMKPILACLLLFLAATTAQRAETWSTPETLWQDAVSQSPGLPGPHISLGAYYMSQGRYPRALQEYQAADLLNLREDLQGKNREMAELFVAMNIADILIRTGQIESGHQVLKQAWLQTPGFPGYAVNLSWFYLYNHEPQKAVGFLNEGIAHLAEYEWFPRKGDLFINRAVAWSRLHQCDLARDDYAKALEYTTDFIEQPCI